MENQDIRVSVVSQDTVAYRVSLDKVDFPEFRDILEQAASLVIQDCRDILACRDLAASVVTQEFRVYLGIRVHQVLAEYPVTLELKVFQDIQELAESLDSQGSRDIQELKEPQDIQERRE